MNLINQGKKKIEEFLPKGGSSRQAFLVVIGDGITLLSSMASGMILARIMSVSYLATYRQISYLGPLAVTIVDFGYGLSVYRYWSYYSGEQRGSFLKFGVLFNGFLGIVASIALFFLANPLSIWYNNPALSSAVIITCSFPFTILPFMMVRPLLLSKGKSLSATMIDTAFAVITTLALIIPSALKMSLESVLISWMISNWLRFPLVLFYYRGVLFTRVRIYGQVSKDVLKYLIPLQVGSIPGIFSSYFDKVLTSVLLGAQSFAAYSLGAREIPFVGSIATSISGVLIPKLVLAYKENNIDQLCFYWRKAISSTAVVTYLVAAFCVWHASPIVTFLFSATYIESSFPFRAFAAVTFIRVVEYGSIAKAIGRSDIIMKSSFISTALYILILLPLILSGGVVGISWGIFIAALTSVVYFLWIYSRILLRPIISFYPYDKLLINVLQAFASVIVVDWFTKSIFNIQVETSIIALLYKLGILFILSAIIYFFIRNFMDRIISQISLQLRDRRFSS